MSDCIFCKIVAGEIPASKVYEDDQVLAFLDITQVTKGHTLVIPKKHYRNVLDMDAEAAGQLFTAVPAIARQLKEKLGASGLNIVNNNEEAAGQTVFHTHIHLLPRFDQNDGLDIQFKVNEPDFPALANLAQEVYLGE
ncbi:TPA: HIT family protein [Streptococcus suis]|uniref:HIT family protein n=1 Tax=Streptococcus iners TaxID=3028084 RepID=A0AA96VM89_9STRE|nr:HIT family protein [Streptococcus sp. 29887]MCK4025385.1 HIT family protein [Streptococcus suis]WNY50799.1 HIT family protein [Streptococcus sp. 29887]HEL9633706.1 HIT family protein [Streptococcus suis]